MATEKNASEQSVNLNQPENPRLRHGGHRRKLSRIHFMVIFGIAMTYGLTSMEMVYLGMSGLVAPIANNQGLASLFKMSVDDLNTLYTIWVVTFITQTFCSLFIVTGITMLRAYWFVPYLISFPMVVMLYVFLSLVSVAAYAGKDPVSFFLVVGGASAINSVLFGIKYLVILNAYDTVRRISGRI